MSMLLESLAAGFVLAGANYADYHTTREALALGGREMGVGSLGMRGGAAAGELGVFMALRREHPKMAWGFVAAVVAVNVAVAHHNMGVSKKLAARW